VGSLAAERFGQVDDVDGFERALFDADAATNAEFFRDEGDLGVGLHLDTKFTHAHDRAVLLAFLIALFGLAFCVVDDGNARRRLLLLLLVVALFRHAHGWGLLF
jgi:hypothetical protein